MIYNYKDDETIQDVILSSYEELVEDIIDEYDSLRRNQALYVYAPAYVAKKVITQLFGNDDYSFYLNDESEIDLLNGIQNDILITVAYDGMVFVEDARVYSGRFKDSDGYSALNYIYDGFKKTDIDKLAQVEDSILVFGFDGIDVENPDCKDCGKKSECKDSEHKDLDKDDKKTSVNVTTPSAKYSVNGKEVDKKVFDKAVKSIEDEYYDSLHDFLLGWCRIQDELNEWRKFFY